MAFPEADEFIARIEATLSGNARPENAITAADVRAVRFSTRPRGYDELTMAEVLDHYARELGRPAIGVDCALPADRQAPSLTRGHGNRRGALLV